MSHLLVAFGVLDAGIRLFRGRGWSQRESERQLQPALRTQRMVLCAGLLALAMYVGVIALQDFDRQWLWIGVAIALIGSIENLAIVITRTPRAIFYTERLAGCALLIATGAIWYLLR